MPDDDSVRGNSFRETLGDGPDPDLTIELLENELIVGRGHVGRTGVFVFQTNRLTLVTSRLPDLLDSVECRLNIGSALHYLSYGTSPAGQTMIDAVQSLPAGHLLRLSPSKLPVRTRVFDTLANSEPSSPDKDGIEAITAAVDEAAIRSCSGESGAALLLSAGIDSSYMAIVLGDRVNACFTSLFPDSSNRGEFDDARRLSRLTGRPHHAVPISTADARAGLERIFASPEPKSAWSTIVHERICEAVSANGHTRLLSGLGADEIFGGYFQYAASFRRIWRQCGRIDPSHVRNPLETLLGSPRWYQGRLFTGVPSFLNAQTLGAAVLPPWRHWDPYQSSVQFYLDALARKPSLHLFEAMIAHEMQHRVPDLLVRGFEEFSREHGLSSAYPFLDPDVIHRGAALGADQRFRRDRATGITRNKLLWREIASGRLPDFVMARPPSTYDAPIHDWFANGAFLDTICDAIMLPSLFDLGLFSRAWIDSLIAELRAMRGRSDPRAHAGLPEHAWVLATFSAWQDRTLDVR